MSNVHDCIDPLDRPVWGAEDIGKIANRGVRQTFYLLETGKIDAAKGGRVWTSTPRRVLRSLGVEACAHSAGTSRSSGSLDM